MKRWKVLFVFVASLTLIGCNKKTDERLIQQSSKYLANNFTNIKEADSFSAKKEQDNLFMVNLNNEEFLFATKPSSNLKNDISFETTNVSKDVEEKFEKAKNNIVEYIITSTVIDESEKNDLVASISRTKVHQIPKRQLKNISTHNMGDSDNIIAFALNNEIFVNEARSNDVTERILTHEFVHLLSDYTNTELKSLGKYTLLDEAITDVITENIVSYKEYSNYSSIWKYAYWFIGTYKESALKSYFYGFNNKNFKGNIDQLEVFLTVVELTTYDHSYETMAIRIINSWN